MQIKLSGLIYSEIWLIYFGLVLFFVIISTGISLADNSTVDMGALTSTITEASFKAESAVVGIEPGQYPQSAITAFNAAISTAQDVANDPSATQTNVDKAVTDLKEAEAIFDAAKITAVNKAALTAALTKASSKAESAVAGIEPGQYPQSAITAFNAAISTAREVANDASATQANVNKAVKDLKAAEAIFDAAKIITVNKATLTAALTKASSKAESAVAGTEVGQYPQSAIDKFNVAISTAQAVANDINVTQAEVNQAVKDLRAAEAIFDAAKIKTVDRTPPSPVTNLKETSVGSSWIQWTWTKPTDSDFSYVKVYLDGTFVTDTPDEFYNATGLAVKSIHIISIETVDTSGNINPALVSDSATTIVPIDTTPPAPVTNLRETSIGSSWIRWTWINPSDGDFKHVMVYIDGSFVTNTSNMDYNLTGLSKGTTHIISTKTVDTSGNINSIWANDSATTSSPGSGGGGGGSSGGSSSRSTISKSSSGSGAAAGSVEAFSNVAMKDVDSEYLRMNYNVTYKFKREGNDIQSVSFYSLKNSGEITSTIEVLNNRSKLVKSNPDGLLYKYINIWVGKAGFATSANIQNARVKFKVNNSWLQDMGVSPTDVRLQRYDGTTWKVLPTILESNTTNYAIFEAQTPGFSPFAITVRKMLASPLNSDTDTQSTHVGDTVLEKIQPENSRVWTYIMAFLLLGLFAVGYEYLKKGQQN